MFRSAVVSNGTMVRLRQMVIDTKLWRLIFILDIFKYLIIINHDVIPRSTSRRERQQGRHAWTLLIS
jgi:hypothetical protein